jgi:hypothetical protein
MVGQVTPVPIAIRSVASDIAPMTPHTKGLCPCRFPAWIRPSLKREGPYCAGFPRRGVTHTPGSRRGFARSFGQGRDASGASPPLLNRLLKLLAIVAACSAFTVEGQVSRRFQAARASDEPAGN